MKPPGNGINLFNCIHSFRTDIENTESPDPQAKPSLQQFVYAMPFQEKENNNTGNKEYPARPFTAAHVRKHTQTGAFRNRRAMTFTLTEWDGVAAVAFWDFWRPGAISMIWMDAQGLPVGQAAP